MMKLERWRENQVPLEELVRILSVVASPPNLRYKPGPNDRQDRHFDAWFDGGSMACDTGGPTMYWFDNGDLVQCSVFSPRMKLTVDLADGRSVHIQQTSDLYPQE